MREAEKAEERRRKEYCGRRTEKEETPYPNDFDNLLLMKKSFKHVVEKK